MKKENFFYILKSQAGVTLVELMIYVGILGGVSLLIATLGVNLNRSNVIREADLLAAEFMQEFQVKMSKKGVCDYNFEGRNSTSLGASFKYSNQIRNTDGTVLYSVGQELENYFTLSDLRIDKVNDTRADITLQFSRKTTNSNAISTLTRRLKLTVVHESDGETINKCLISFDQDIGDQLPLICNGEGVILSDSGTPLDVSDDICIHAGYSIEQCPSTEYVQRFELVNIDDGSGKLQPFYRPVCIAADKPKSLLCPAGEVLQGYSAVDGLICRPLVITDIRAHFLGDYTSCALDEKFPIKMVGSNNNIHCGPQVYTPTPTATTTATATPSPTAIDASRCITVHSEEFVVQLPLSNPLGNGLNRIVTLFVTGTRQDGTIISFRAFFGDVIGGGVAQKLISGLSGGFTYPGLWKFSPPEGQPNPMNYLYFQRTAGLPADPGDYGAFVIGMNPVEPSDGTWTYCTVGHSKQYCALILNPPRTGLEGVKPLKICADDSDSATQPMFNYSDPFNVL